MDSRIRPLRPLVEQPPRPSRCEKVPGFPATLDQAQIDDLIDTIQAPYPERTIRTIRAALRTTDDPAEQANLVLGVIGDLGLEPFVPPEPLPEITSDDVHLVCWIAITSDPRTDAAWYPSGQMPMAVADATGQRSLPES